MTALNGWGNFYVIVGSSAGALIGLQFVVITLIAQMPIRAGMAQASSAFATPTIVHFAAVLLLSAVLSVPWNGIGNAAVFWGLVGLCVCKLHTNRCSRTGCFMFCCLSRPTQCLPHRRMWLSRMCADRCLAWEPRRCCCSSSAFIMLGTA